MKKVIYKSFPLCKDKIKKVEKLGLRCAYCERSLLEEDMLAQLK